MQPSGNPARKRPGPNQEPSVGACIRRLVRQRGASAFVLSFTSTGGASRSRADRNRGASHTALWCAPRYRRGFLSVDQAVVSGSGERDQHSTALIKRERARICQTYVQWQRFVFRTRRPVERRRAVRRCSAHNTAPNEATDDSARKSSALRRSSFCLSRCYIGTNRWPMLSS
jgi:hypothetical protein